MDFFGPILISFHQPWPVSDNAGTDIFEPIFGGDTAFAPSIYIIKITQLCLESQIKKGKFIELSVKKFTDNFFFLFFD